MVKENLFLNKCIVCGIRCDKMGKSNIMEIKQEMLEKIKSLIFKSGESPKIGDYMCRKHDRKLKRSDNSVILESSTTSTLTSTFDFSTKSLESSTLDFCVDFNNNFFDEHENEYTAACSNTQTSNNYKNVDDDANEDQERYVVVDMPRTYASHSFCFICKAKSGNSSLYY